MVWSLFKSKPKLPELQRLSFRPSIWCQENFLTDAECNHLIHYALPKLEPATVLDPETGKSIRHPARTSSLTFIPFHHDPVMTAVEKRLAQWLQLPVENGEDTQLLRYALGEEYIPHYDFFNPNLVGRSRELAKGGQRMVTVLLYLNDVDAGGETVFPKINMEITPQKGMALVFYNTDADGNVDMETWHGSKPVLAGEKWVATKWIRQQPFIRKPL